MHPITAAALLAPAIPGPAPAGPPTAAALWVTNAANVPCHFTLRGLDPDGPARRDLAPGEMLCRSHPGRGVAADLDTAAEVEGCPRLVPPAGHAVLIAFGRHDRCARGRRSD